MGESGVGRSTGESFPILYMGNTKSVGGNNIKATQNIPFEILTPQIQHVTVRGTNIDGEVRTISGSSLSGNEIPYIDQGFEAISISRSNYFSTPRIIASKDNEDTYLDELPGNKSFTMNLDLITDDTRISPAVDLNQTSVIFTSNRINEPISDFASDPRVNSTENDPNRFFYVTKNVNLENPASGLQIFLDAYVPTDADIRAFYALNQDGPVDDVVFVPFPGFGNFQSNGTIASPGASNGSSDVLVPKVDTFTPTPDLSQYREYKFSVDSLPSFKSFRIKLIGTSTNQATVPMVRNFRAISLA